MFDVLTDINWLAAGLAAVTYFMLGALWFTPLFGKAYDKGIGVDRSSTKKWPAMYYIGPFLSSVVVTFAAAVLLYALDVQHMSEALLLDAVVGAALASISVSNAISPNTPRPLLLGSIIGSYHLVSVLLVATVLYLTK